MKSRKGSFFYLLFFGLVGCSLRLEAQTYWQQEVDYKINVVLDDREKTLDGFVTMRYVNHSPDTLRYIWIHLWPNAFRNDETAFSEQSLGNGRTDFYFSDKTQKGYINRLDFRVDGAIAVTEDHPQYIDVVRVILPHPLAPGGRSSITTPFHEKLPYAFARSGYAHGTFHIAQWYPRPAVYDHSGWHPMPYPDQGGLYGEFGHYDVTITVPGGYVVAATGRAEEISPATPATRTWRCIQDHLQDFAWFADKQYHTDHDTLSLPSGRVIDLYAYYRPAANIQWKSCMQYLKDAIRFRSSAIGEYPFDVAAVAETRMGPPGSAGYPTLAAINGDKGVLDLDLSIEHAMGCNWFGFDLGTDGQRWPWMDEGMNAFYDRRYREQKYPGRTYLHGDAGPWPFWPDDMARITLSAAAAQRLDQPISTAAETFSQRNYSLIAAQKTRLWLEGLERALGKALFDSGMQAYFRDWQFRHPYPEDFRAVMEATSHRELGRSFAMLDQRGAMPPPVPHRRIQAAFETAIIKADSISYINIFPAIGYNKYDDFMAGLVVHNYDLPASPFQFLFCPLYAHESKQLNGLARFSYSWFPSGPGESGAIHRIHLAVAAAKFSTFSGTDSNGRQLYGGFYKVVPSLRLTLNNASVRSTADKWIEWKTYLIGERALDHYVRKSADSLFYPTKGNYAFRYLNQLSIHAGDNRVLYPYRGLLQFQQAPEWYRINFEGNYFFNYSKGGGMAVRLFAAKFGFVGGGNSSLDLSGYEPKLTAVRGNEDYTYSNYFIGRNEFTGFASQQIMMRDGGLKIRTDLFQGLQGRSDNWVAAINFNSTLPQGLVPAWLPLRVFFDVGTYAESWKPNPPTDKFLYTGGLQLSLLKDVVHIYAPLFYSHVFIDNLKTVPGENGFWKKVSFSIDLQKPDLHQIFPYHDL
ncbi:MAG: M1 family metallopeptidase [Bacteroidota bacterium]|nr:M1 family metallopeptidase [Bacteroidota bacterium]